MPISQQGAHDRRLLGILKLKIEITIYPLYDIRPSNFDRLVREFYLAGIPEVT